MSVTVDEVCELARSLPRATEAFVQGRVKFRVGRVVWLAFSRDGTELGFAYPKEWRQALVDSDPETFRLPRESDMRYRWAVVRLERLTPEAMRDLVLEAWSMVVPQCVVDEYLLVHDPD